MKTIAELLEQHSKGIVKEQIRKIVEIYDLEWYVVHELVQNAIDAVQANERVASGKIEVVLDIDTDTVVIKDVGKGFDFDLNLLCPGGSGAEKRLSSRSSAKGYQGVGLKAVMYSTLYFELESQTEEMFWRFTAHDLASYIAPNSTTDPTYETFEEKGHNQNTWTKVTARFPGGTLSAFIDLLGRHLNEDTVKWYDLYKEERDYRKTAPINRYIEHFVAWYFRTQSYVGCVNRLLNVPVASSKSCSLEEIKPIIVEVEFRSDSEFSSIANRGLLGHWLAVVGERSFKVSVPNQYWDFSEVIAANGSRAAKYRIVPPLVTIHPSDPKWNDLKDTFRDKFWDIKLRRNDDGRSFRERYQDFLWLVERPRSNSKAEDYEDILEKVTGIYLAIGRTSSFEMLGVPNHGLRLIASNGTVTEHDITISSTSSTWYLETMHMVINLDATLNLGKRHLSNPRLVGRVKDFFKACYPTLVSVSKLFVERDSSSTNDEPMPEVVPAEKIWRQGIPFRRFPKDENTLIGIFSALIPLLDSDFSVYGLFSKAIYDGKFLWDSKDRGSDKELRLLEFKLELDALIHEFETSIADKEFSEVQLIVVWDRRVTVPGWTVKGISSARRNQLENRGVPTDLVEFILEDRFGTYCPLICVADLLTRRPLLTGKSDDIERLVSDMN